MNGLTDPIYLYGSKNAMEAIMDCCKETVDKVLEDAQKNLHKAHYMKKYNCNVVKGSLRIPLSKKQNYYGLKWKSLIIPMVISQSENDTIKPFPNVFVFLKELMKSDNLPPDIKIDANIKVKCTQYHQEIFFADLTEFHRSSNPSAELCVKYTYMLK